MDSVSFDDFKKIEIKMGKIVSCEKVENADKLLRLQVDFGEFQRQIISGIAQSFEPSELVGKTLPFIVNLEYRKFRGEESQGMLMATTSNVAGAGGGSVDTVVLLEPSGEVEPGAEVV